MEPYIGVTGFMSLWEIERVLSVFPHKSGWKLMVGVLGSQKTLIFGERNKWPNQYPKQEDISAIFPDDPRTLNLLHYNTKNFEFLRDQLIDVTDICGERMHGIQLNMAWPAVAELRKYRKRCPGKMIVLQVGKSALYDKTGRLMSPSQIATLLSFYEDAIDYVLFDLSSGMGKALNSDFLIPYIESVHPYFSFRIVVGGGLSAETIGIVRPILMRYPDVSIDAQRLLRTKDGRLSVPAAQRYVQEAHSMYPQLVSNWCG